MAECAEDEYDLFGTCKACSYICTNAKQVECKERCPAYYDAKFVHTTTATTFPWTTEAPDESVLVPVLVSLCVLFLIIAIAILLYWYCKIRTRTRNTERPIAESRPLQEQEARRNPPIATAEFFTSLLEVDIEANGTPSGSMVPANPVRDTEMLTTPIQATSSLPFADADSVLHSSPAVPRSRANHSESRGDNDRGSVVDESSVQNISLHSVPSAGSTGSGSPSSGVAIASFMETERTQAQKSSGDTQQTPVKGGEMDTDQTNAKGRLDQQPDSSAPPTPRSSTRTEPDFLPLVGPSHDTDRHSSPHNTALPGNLSTSSSASSSTSTHSSHVYQSEMTVGAGSVTPQPESPQAPPTSESNPFGINYRSN